MTDNKLSSKSCVTLHNGVKMPIIGFGTWKILPNSKAQRVVGEAFDAGYRYVDTARIYLNEKGVGAAIDGSGIARDEIFVSTKLWNSDQGGEKPRIAFDKSLERLQLDYVDLYLMHWPVAGKRLESWKVLEEIYKTGRAKAIGVCNFTEEHLAELIDNCEIVPMVNQVEFHPFLNQKMLQEYCNEHNIHIEAYSPLAHGKRMQDKTLIDIANKYSKSTAQVMLRWNIHIGNIVIPKSTSKERIVENIDIFDFEIDKKDMDRIENLNENLRTCWDPTGM